MYNDSLGDIFSALEGKHPDFAIEELDIKITIGNKEIEIPMYADAFEMLFECLNEMHDDIKHAEEE
jgi:hypothetical protein